RSRQRMANTFRHLPMNLKTGPASKWLQHSVRACTFPGTTAQRLREQLRLIAGSRGSIGSAPRHRWKTSSSICWQAPGTISNCRVPSMRALSFIGAGGFWRRAGAMLRKEFLQLRRDRITFATMVTIPLLQLVLFGYAINTTPRQLPTAVLVQESSDVGRSILAAIQNTKFFRVTEILRDNAEFDLALASGNVLFAVEIPANFERAVRRGDKPA